MKKTIWITTLAMFGILAGLAFAQFTKSEDAIKYRQSVMVLVGQHFSRMGAMVKDEAPYAKIGIG